MTELNNCNDRRKQDECQDPPANSVGDIFIFPKDFTATEHTLAWLDALVGAIPPDEVYPDFYLKLFIKTMQALTSTPEEINYLTMAVEELAEQVRQINNLPSDIQDKPGGGNARN